MMETKNAHLAAITPPDPKAPRVRTGAGRKPQVTKRIRADIDRLQDGHPCTPDLVQWLADYLAHYDHNAPARAKNRVDTYRRLGRTIR